MSSVGLDSGCVWALCMDSGSVDIFAYHYALNNNNCIRLVLHTSLCNLALTLTSSIAPLIMTEHSICNTEEEINRPLL